MSKIKQQDFYLMSDDERLEHIQRSRHDVVNMFLLNKDGSKVEMIDAKESGQLVRGMLKDMDSSIYTKRRLAVDEVSAENDKRIADMADEIMSKVRPMGRSKEMYESSNSNGPVINEAELVHYAHTKGETEPVGNQVDLDAIVRDGRKLFKGIDEDSDN